MKPEDNSLVCIIMPAYNAEKYLHEAIESVVAQTHGNWQLLIINDGSTDNTERIVKSYKDNRITYFKQQNKGVSAARNVGLAYAKGEFICFLDADDVLTPISLEHRLKIFQNDPNVSFVDGTIYNTNSEINSIQKVWRPSFKGYPHRELVRLKETCFGTVSWMIRRDAVGDIRFHENTTHAEDLLFFIEVAPHRQYSYTESPILSFRRTGTTAMANLDGLGRGYLEVLRILTQKKLFPSNLDRSIYKFKMIKIMFLSYLAAGKVIKASQFVLKNLLA